MPRRKQAKLTSHKITEIAATKKHIVFGFEGNHHTEAQTGDRVQP
jgi:hypothetical protein